MAGTCGMMGGRRHKKRHGGQPPREKNAEELQKTLKNITEAEKEAKNQNEVSNNLKDKNFIPPSPFTGRSRRNRRGSKKTRKYRGGNGYGFTATAGDVINAGNIAWTPNMTSVPSGQPVVGSVTGGRRKSRKGAKRNGRKKTMKGGGSVANVGYGFAGTGARGIADAIPYPSNLPPSGEFAIPTGTR